MAMQKVSGQYGETVYLGNDPKKKDQVKQFAGFYIGNCRTVVKEEKRGKKVYHFADFVREDKAEADPVSVLCPGQLFSVLTDRSQRGEKDLAGLHAPNPRLLGRWVQVDYKGKEKVAGFSQPLHQCDVAYDDAKQVKYYELTPLA